MNSRNYWKRLKNSKKWKNGKKIDKIYMLRFTCFIIGYNILSSVLNMSGSSRFIFCPIVLKSWVKSPIEYTFFFLFGGPVFLMTAVMTQSYEKSPFLTFFHSVSQNFNFGILWHPHKLILDGLIHHNCLIWILQMSNSVVHRNRGRWYQLLSLKNRY